MGTQHENAISQDTIDRVASALESADIGHSMSLTRLIDGIHTYTLKIRGEIETFVDSDEANAIDQVYARIREVKHRLQAEAVIAALHAPLPIAGKGDEGWRPIETAPKDGTPILAIYPWQGSPRFMVIRRHKEHPWWMADHDSYIKHDDSKDTHRNFGFTHWRPLPAPPSILSQDTEGGV